MKSIIFVDTQKDFMLPSGKLYVNGAENLLVNIHALNSFFPEDDKIYTLDTHEPEDEEFKTYPSHCVVGTDGWNNIINEPYLTFCKSTYDMWDKDLGFPEQLEELHEDDFFSGEVYICGVALDICVKACIDGLLNTGWVSPEKIFLITDATKGLGNDEDTFEYFRKKGVQMITTKEVVK